MLSTCFYIQAAGVVKCYFKIGAILFPKLTKDVGVPSMMPDVVLKSSDWTLL